MNDRHADPGFRLFCAYWSLETTLTLHRVRKHYAVDFEVERQAGGWHPRSDGASMWRYLYSQP